ncbi:MAG: FAD-dependent oxidoreductase [Actinomycetota bacterium]
MSRVAVLGAGPSGLYAALAAAEAGHDVEVFEAAPAVGGMAGSFEVAGQRVDFGSHRLHPATDPQIMARIRDLLGDDLQARERRGRIRLRDRWVGFPLRSVDMVRSLPLDFSARAAFDTLTGPLRRESDGSFAGEITRRLGPTIHREFYAPYAVKLYGAASNELSSELADRRVAAGSPIDVLKKAVGARNEEGRRFWYPRNGYGQIAEAFADAATEAGASISLASPVAGLTRSAGEAGWSVAVGTSSGDEASSRTTQVDVVLSSIPSPVLADIIDPAPGTEVDGALAQLRNRGMVLVYLVVPRDQYTPFDAHYFPELEVRTARLSEPKNYRDGDDPSGQTVLCAEVACWPGDDVWTADVEGLAELVTDDLGRAGLPAPDAVHAEVRRLPNVYPVFEPSTASARVVVDRWQAALDGVVSFGRQGLNVPDNLHHVLAMGAAAAGAVGDGGTIDRTVWQTSLDEFATHVVQD